ncbi:MAG: DUF2723 domain-containing protein [Anaerolineae bacterium]
MRNANALPQPRQPRSRWLLPILVALAFLALYATTVAPGILPADSGEYQLAAATLGIAHPPGYPLYIMLGWAFTRLTPGDPAWGLNLLSTLLAAATLAVVVLGVQSLPLGAKTPVTRVVAPLAAALTLAGATTFWAQATTANIRSLVALFTALLFWLGLRALVRPIAARLAWLALITGLALSHHGSLAFVALPVWAAVGWAWLAERREGRAPCPNAGIVVLGMALLLVVGAIGLLPVLYLPLRGAPGVPPHPEALVGASAVLDHALARGFGGDMFAFARPTLLPDRLSILADILDIQFGWLLVALAALGVVRVVLRGRVGLLLGGGFILPAFVAVTYRAPQTVEYMMPAYVAFALLVGAALTGDWASGLSRLKLAQRRSAVIVTRAAQVVALLVALIVAAANIVALWPSYAALHADDSTRQAAEAFLAAAPPNAPAFAGWHQATPLWYLQYVTGLRQDVGVQYVPPAGAEYYPTTWRERLEDATQSGPSLATNRYPTYADAPFTIAPAGPGFVAQRGDPPIPDGAPAVGVPFQAGLELVAAQWGQPPKATAEASTPLALGAATVEAGEGLTIDLYWRMNDAAASDLAFYVHLVDGEGRVVGQADVGKPAAALGEGRTFVTRHAVPVLPTTAPGVYRLVAGAYQPTPDGPVALSDSSAPLGEVGVAPSSRFLVTSHPFRRTLNSGVTLVGADWDTTVPDGRRVYLHWHRDVSGAPIEAHLVVNGETAAEITIPDAPTGSLLTTAADLPPDGEVSVAVGDQHVVLGAPDEGERWVNYGGKAALVGASAHREGRDLVVDLAWLGLQPLLADYSVTVKARGDGWGAANDGTPAQGAIPTFKWVGGMLVHDRRRLTLPENAQGPVSVTVGMYDAFTTLPLTVLDDRLLLRGQGEEPVILVVP